MLRLRQHETETKSGAGQTGERELARVGVKWLGMNRRLYRLQSQRWSLCCVSMFSAVDTTCSVLWIRYLASSTPLAVATLISLMPAPAIRSPHEAPKVSIDPEPVHPPLYLPPETHSTSPCIKVYKQQTPPISDPSPTTRKYASEITQSPYQESCPSPQKHPT